GLSRYSALTRSAVSPSTSAQERAAEAKSKSVPYASNTQARTPESGRFGMCYGLLVRGSSRAVSFVGQRVRRRHMQWPAGMTQEALNRVARSGQGQTPVAPLCVRPHARCLRAIDRVLKRATRP